MAESVLFDLYGTLIDIHTDEASNWFWEKFAKKCKRYHNLSAQQLKASYLEQCKQFSKLKEEIEICDVFQAIFQIDLVKIKKIAVLFRRLSTEYIRCYPGVRRLLKNLREKGIRLYVLSNAQSAFTIPELKRLRILGYFDGIAISSDYGVKKPNPAFLNKAIENFNLDPAHCWMIGNDYECDILPAKACGIKTIYIESNLSPEKKEVEKLMAFDRGKIKSILIKYER